MTTFCSSVVVDFFGKSKDEAERVAMAFSIWIIKRGGKQFQADLREILENYVGEAPMPIDIDVDIVKFMVNEHTSADLLEFDVARVK